MSIPILLAPRTFIGPLREGLVPGKRIVTTELFPEGELITFDDDSEAVYPKLPWSDPDPRFTTYTEMLPNDPETHLDPDAFAGREPLCLMPEILRLRYPERFKRATQGD